ncbi:glycosyltransferase family 39 protein [Patescibacteria group bacterium]|nr:glycosyltransferase family 39 protein [Patescibacteria group bacterium]
MKFVKKYLFIAVFLLALFFRLYKLGEFPVGFLWDEAGLGYNAYSILKTGRDEYGKLLPLIFKSFGDHKPGFYIYLAVPSIALLGLNELAVRLPSAIFGSFSVLFIYLLLKEQNRLKLALISSTLLAISPWHLSFSRGAWELNVMTFEILGGLYFLIKYINSKKIFYLYVSGIFWILTLFTYQSAKALVPAILLGFVFFFRKELKEVSFKPKFGFAVFFLSSFLFFNFLTATGGRSGRIKVMSVFSYPRSPEETQMLNEQDGKSRVNWTLFHSAPVFFSRGVLGRYLNHFSGKFLFFSGDWSNARNGVVYHGVLYLIDVVFLAIGLGILFSRKRTPLENLMLYWLLLAPLPSAVTRDIISSVRSFTMVIPLTFLAALGVDHFLTFASKSKYFKLPAYLLLVTCYLLLFFRFLDLYFIHDPKISSDNRLYGYKQAVQYINPLIGQKDKVVFTDIYGQPYIFYLFYSKYDPAKYQKQAFLVENPYGDVGKVERIDNIEFRNIYWPKDRSFNNSLFIGNEFDLPITDVVGQNNITLLKEIEFLDDKTAFRIVETK